MLFPVDDSWRIKESLTGVWVPGIDVVSIGVVIEVVCHILLSENNNEPSSGSSHSALLFLYYHSTALLEAINGIGVLICVLQLFLSQGNQEQD